MSMIHPPSPAFSACHSLDGSDLDVFLADQGALSHFPTPPPKQDPVVEAIELLQGLAQRETEAAPRDYDRTASVLAQQASIDEPPDSGDWKAIRALLVRADLPLEVVAIAHNILAGLRAHHDTVKGMTDTPRDLLVVATLSLALSYTSDNPPRTSWWSRHVCDCTWTSNRIDMTIMEVLLVLDFRLHSYSNDSRLQDALLKLSCKAAISADQLNDCPTMAAGLTAKQALELRSDGSSTLWQHGQLTPDSCASPVAAVCPLPLAECLPLL